MEIVEAFVDPFAQLTNPISPPPSHGVIAVVLSGALSSEVAAISGEDQATVDGRLPVCRVQMQRRQESGPLIR